MNKQMRKACQQGRKAVSRSVPAAASRQPVKCYAQQQDGLSRRQMMQAGLAGALVLPSVTGNAGLAQASEVVDVASIAANQAAIPRIDLAPGLNISRVIKGSWQLAGGHRGEAKTDRTSGQKAVDDMDIFVRGGITTFDCADHYGPAEELIGSYLDQHREQRGNVQVLDKVCLFRPAEMVNLSFDTMVRGVELSRKRLGVQSIDLMQYYWGDYSIDRYVDGALYLADLQAAGKIKNIGVTNFDVPTLQKLVDSGVKIVSNQVQYSLLDTRPENGMVEFCKANNIQLLAFGAVAGGFLTDKYRGMPLNRLKVDTWSKGKYGRVINEVGGWDYVQELLYVLSTVAEKHDVSLANVATRWVLEKPQVAGVIIGARNANHVADHQKLFSFDLDAEDRQLIDDAISKGRRPQTDVYTWERGGAW